MSTRSAIGIKNADGTVSAIYCHYDGYPEYNGAILKEFYPIKAKVEELIQLGAISALKERTYPIGENHTFNNPEPLTTIAYHRDRGEEYVPPMLYPDQKAYYWDWERYDAEYMYLFIPKDDTFGEWQYKDIGTGVVHSL